MQNTTPNYQASSVGAGRQPVQGVSISWLKNSALGAFFTIGTSTIGSGDIIKGNDNNPAQADTFSYDDESDHALAIEWEREFREPIFSVSRGLADITFENTTDRFTPGVDPEIANYILPQRPMRMYAGFTTQSGDEKVQVFVGQIADFPVNKADDKTTQIHCLDYMDTIWNYPIEQTQLYLNKTTDQLLSILLINFGLAPSKFVLDKGLITVPFAYFGAGNTIGNIIQNLVEAEEGVFYVDELGNFRFENRIHMLDAPHTQQRNLTMQIAQWTSGDAKWQPPAALVTAGITYYFRDRYICNIVSKLVYEVTDNTGAKTYPFIGTIPVANTWTQMPEFAWTAPANTVSVSCWHLIDNVGVLQTDDYYLVPVSQSYDRNLIPNFSTEIGTPPVSSAYNPYFLANIYGWSFIQAAAFAATETDTSVVWDAETYYNGGSMFFQVGANAGSLADFKGQSYAVSGITVGQAFTASIWVKGMAGGEKVNMTSACLTNASVNVVLTGGVWQLIQISGTANATSGSVKITTINQSNVAYKASFFQFIAGYGAPDSWIPGGYGTNQRYPIWTDRGLNDVSFTIIDDQVLTETVPTFSIGGNTGDPTTPVVNLVEIFANPRQATTTNVKIFGLGVNDSRKVPAGGSISFVADYVDTNNNPLPIISLITPTAAGAQSNWTGNSTSDGTGTNQTSSLTLTSFTNYSTNSQVVFGNATGADIYITALNVFGVSAPITQPIYVKVQDSASILTYGQQGIQITNDFIQTYATANTIATNIVANRKSPANYLLTTMQGHPEFQLGDRVRRNGKDFWIIRIQNRFTPDDGLLSTLTLMSRGIAPVS